MTKKKGNKRKVLIWVGVLSVLVVALAAYLAVGFMDARVSRELTVEEAQEIVDATLKELPKGTADGAIFVTERSDVTVKDVSYGTEKNVILKCEYTSVDILSAFREDSAQILSEVYGVYAKYIEENGRKPVATALRQSITGILEETTQSAESISGEVTLTLYEVKKGEFDLYRNDEVINTCFGGLVELSDYIDTLVELEYQGETIDITNTTTLRTAIKDCYNLTNYESAKPEVKNELVKFWNDFYADFHNNFIKANRWVYLAQGLGTTLAITALAGLLGIVLGFAVAIVRCTYQIEGKLGFLDKICGAYLTVIRGTPVMVQLLIIYFVILLPIGVPKFLSAVLCFGLNSGAYVAEIVRGGIMAIDKGQMEAGRSLGFGYAQSMIHFIMPQAFKAVLPSLANEFITLLKESSVAFYIGVADLTQGGLKIRSVTYSTFMPLIAVALIYLVIVLILTKLVGILERRLRKSDR